MCLITRVLKVTEIILVKIAVSNGILHKSCTPNFDCSRSSSYVFILSVCYLLWLTDQISTLVFLQKVND